MQTRYSEIEIWKQDKGLWRYVIDKHVTGPQFATRIEALSYLDTFAVEYGYDRM